MVAILQFYFTTFIEQRHQACAIRRLVRQESQSGRAGSCVKNRFPRAIFFWRSEVRRRRFAIEEVPRRETLAAGREVRLGSGGLEDQWRKLEGKLRCDRGVSVGGVGEDKSEVSTVVAEEEEEEVKEAPLIDSMADLLNLEKQFAFYGAYHSNKLNVLIHMMFVWPIFFTNGILWAYTPSIIALPLPAGTLPLQQYMVLNVNFLIASIYALYYAALDKKAGSIGAAICLGCWIGSQAVAQVWPWSTAWKFVLIAQITCWTFQFIGHGVFEGRAPALLDNLPQAFLMAPFFVLLEFLQSFLGYQPYPGFRENVEKKTQQNIAEWRARKGKKAA